MQHGIKESSQQEKPSEETDLKNKETKFYEMTWQFETNVEKRCKNSAFRVCVCLRVCVLPPDGVWQWGQLVVIYLECCQLLQHSYKHNNKIHLVCKKYKYFITVLRIFQVFVLHVSILLSFASSLSHWFTTLCCEIILFTLEFKTCKFFSNDFTFYCVRLLPHLFLAPLSEGVTVFVMPHRALIPFDFWFLFVLFILEKNLLPTTVHQVVGHQNGRRQKQLYTAALNEDVCIQSEGQTGFNCANIRCIHSIRPTAEYHWPLSGGNVIWQ